MHIVGTEISINKSIIDYQMLIILSFLLLISLFKLLQIKVTLRLNQTFYDQFFLHKTGYNIITATANL